MSAEDGADPAPEEPKQVPVSALIAERKARQELEAKLAKIEADSKAQADAEAAKRGEFEGLYKTTAEKLTAAETRLADLSAKEIARLDRIKAKNEERVKALPEAARKLVPPLDPDAVSAWLDDAEPALAPATFAAGGKRPPAVRPDVKYPPEAMAKARQYSVDKTEDGLKKWIQDAWLPTREGQAWQAKQGGGGG